MMSHASRINYERAKIMAEIDRDEKKDEADVKPYVKDDTGKIRASKGGGPKRGKMSADDYRDMMRMQGIRFRKPPNRQAKVD